MEGVIEIQPLDGANTGKSVKSAKGKKEMAVWD